MGQQRVVTYEVDGDDSDEGGAVEQPRLLGLPALPQALGEGRARHALAPAQREKSELTRQVGLDGVARARMALEEAAKRAEAERAAARVARKAA